MGAEAVVARSARDRSDQLHRKAEAERLRMLRIAAEIRRMTAIYRERLDGTRVKR